jgi:hypothetical protein
VRRTHNKGEDPSNLAALDTEPICVFRDSQPRPPRLRGRTNRIDGLKVRIADGPALSDGEFARALRMLARMMLHNQHADRDDQAIVDGAGASSPLTLGRDSRPDHTDEAA